MIAYIHGKLAVKEPTHVILDVQGVGYHIHIPLTTYEAIRDTTGELMLHTHLHIKEDAHTLFGFKDVADRALFLDLISVSGIGPTTALVMLSSMQPKEIMQAIVYEEVATIQKVKGIGAKTAQRVILELKDKLRKAGLGDSASSVNLGAGHNTARNEALTALVTLGIAKNAAEKTLDAVIKKHGQDLSVEDLIKLALKAT
ncbi:MAG TPA: Holliday junction branch migration protein RuvA [Cytophagales bacterium]|nr:Holliday junction branch migration protein RuvA [Cytophagales bacterium]HAA23019.1 Holliday junction branch migration protein RuvA [Cytophagales bacterium]HAP60377.1 Holliday junction branch migration protein RuvA [Cytophagales bacterium]